MSLRVCNKSSQKSSVLFSAALGVLNPLPRLIHLFERAILNPSAGLFERVFYLAKAREKALVGGLQFTGRIGVQETGKVDYGKKQVTQFTAGIAGFAVGQGLANLVKLLEDLVKDGGNVRPIEANTRGIFLDLKGILERVVQESRLRNH